ncbi:DUF2330 domain-containing protein [Streptomyces sp. NBC_01465]|uniref:DUF2330 domain-containing protein n=1 Tax=Streptomyces sp. NBC_01465 TaxID=2903878 RepID=UPI002E33776F|nr:DUF2330 domain-containing protein [Streptomyces sp. NBC_01465]
MRYRAVLALLALLAALQLGSLVSPAYACGCGAMVHDPADRLDVNRETSAVRWDGRTEQIVMSLTVSGTARTAAWIMPVPHRASVTLGDRKLFDELEKITAPVHRTRTHFLPDDGDWPFDGSSGSGDGAPRATAPAPRVQVVGRETLGPFDVARLTATDPAALGSWLHTNGFDLPAGLTADLRPYTALKWEYVAIRLAPQQQGTPLSGTLDPLALSFASDRLVYPMRLSRRAKTEQYLSLYVLASHRMEPKGRIGGMRPAVTYAGKVDSQGPVGQLAAGESYLTALNQSFPVPSEIDGDHELTRTAADTPYQQVIYTDKLMTLAGIPAWLLTTLGALALAVAAVTLLLVRAHRRRPVIPPLSVRY